MSRSKQKIVENEYCCECGKKKRRVIEVENYTGLFHYCESCVKKMELGFRRKKK